MKNIKVVVAMVLALLVAFQCVAFAEPTAEEKVEAFVVRCYQKILGREPDESGLKDWKSQLINKTRTAAEIIRGFVNSVEFKGKNLSDEDSVEILYNTMLNRGSDPDGKANWVNKLDKGSSLEDVINGFCGSTEFGNLCKEYGITAGSLENSKNGSSANNNASSADIAKVQAFVTRCYQKILGREPDEGGLNNWVDSLASQKNTAAQIINSFMGSEEFRNKNLSNADTVEILYNAMLNRGSDPSGKANWVNKLNDDGTVQDIINGFCGSKEFETLCNTYGITPGSVRADAGSNNTNNKNNNNNNSANTKPADIERVKAFVTRCYQGILGREPDAGGLDHWTEKLTSGDSQAANIVEGFINSPEFMNRNLSNSDSVEILYNAMLGRGSDPSGKADWMEKLDNGSSLNAVVSGFCGSAEFKSICDEYGITPGTVKSNNTTKPSYNNGNNTPQNNPVNSNNNNDHDNSIPSVNPVVTMETVTVDAPVPCSTETQNDASRIAGDADIVIREGQDGVKRYVYSVTYTDGVETGRTLQSETVITEPVSRIISHAVGANPEYVVTQEAETVEIPYETENIPCEYVYAEGNGYKQDIFVTQNGANGKKEIVYEVKKDLNGNLISRTVVSETVTQAPVNEVVYYGTFTPEVTYQVVHADLDGMHGSRSAKLDADCEAWAQTMANNKQVAHSDPTGSKNEYSESVGGWGTAEDAAKGVAAHGGTVLAYGEKWGVGIVARTETTPTGNTQTTYYACARGSADLLPDVPFD